MTTNNAVLTAKQMRALDQYAIHELGIPELVLMENAGKEIYRYIVATIPQYRKKTFIVFAGTGNNGGDGMVVARYLSLAGLPVKVMITGVLRKLSRSARIQRAILQKMNVPIAVKEEIELSVLSSPGCVVIDGMLGTGFSGKVREPMRTIISVLNSSPAQVISIDIPSGLNADTGKSSPIAVRADWTITLGAYKKGLFQSVARPFVGKLRVVDIGLPLLQWQKEKK